ncbi:MAG: hypothetical protein GF405_06415 [Candidatus Eisenbacteria bacterium]|nr:hypothetical protein [Candidatus Eisenbacteria bacterium]
MPRPLNRDQAPHGPATPLIGCTFRIHPSRFVLDRPASRLLQMQMVVVANYSRKGLYEASMSDPQREILTIILGDAVASRTEEDRQGMEAALRRTCDAINAAFGADVRAPFSPIKGVDEFGGALVSHGRLHRIVAALIEGLFPVQYRLVAVRGEVDTGLASSDIALMDGPAFHRAAHLMEQLKGERLLFEASLEDALTEALLAGYLNLLAFHLGDLSDRQWEVVRAFEREGTQERAAGAVGVTQQTVSKTLARARWQEIQALQARLDGALAERETPQRRRTE